MFATLRLPTPLTINAATNTNTKTTTATVNTTDYHHHRRQLFDHAMAYEQARYRFEKKLEDEHTIGKRACLINRACVRPCACSIVGLWERSPQANPTPTYPTPNLNPNPNPNL